jgi:hypothetical protein
VTTRDPAPLEAAEGGARVTEQDSFTGDRKISVPILDSTEPSLARGIRLLLAGPSA